MTSSAVQARVSEVRSTYQPTNPTEACDLERELWRDVLEAIRGGHLLDAMQMQILAREALKTLDSTGT